MATLCWNHHAHLECYFGIPAAGGVMHTLNLRLAPEEIGWIAADAQDRVLIVDDVLATGGTAAGMVKLVESCGGKVCGLGFILELLFLNGASKLVGHRHESLLTY